MGQKIIIMGNHTRYQKNIRGRSHLRFLIGIVPRVLQYIRHDGAPRIAQKRGAIIGADTILPLTLAKRANPNLIVGDRTSIQTDTIDLRFPVTIGHHVIIGYNTEIITTSHDINSPDWEQKHYGIEIADYAWIPTKILVLPSCRKIGQGAVIGSGSVVVQNVEPMSVVSDNPAKEIRKRKNIHTDLIVESLLGGDLKAYIRTRKGR